MHTPSSSRSDRRHATWLFAISFLFYLSTTVGVLEYGDDWSMLQVTSSIVEHGTIAVPPTTLGSSPGLDGRHYSKYGLGQSLLAIPFYVAGVRSEYLTGLRSVEGDQIRQATPLTFVVTILGMIATALSVAVFFLSLRMVEFSVLASSVSALGLGLATFAWYWALTFMTEPTSMLMIVVAFYAHLRDGDRPSPGWLAVGGAALAFALLLRMANVIVLPGFGLWLLWQVSRTHFSIRTTALRIAAWSLPLMAGMAAVAAYNVARFGNVTDTGYGNALSQMSGSMWVGVYGVLFSPGRSMFLYAPILIAAAVGWVPLWRTRRYLGVAIASIAVPYVLFHSRLPYWDSGGCWSPRYITAILPLLMVGLAALIDRGLKPAGWFALGLVGVGSVAVQGLGIVVPCIPYASRMLATEASADRLIWHAGYSPLVEHGRSFLAQELPLHLAPVFHGSATLAWFQASAFVSALLLLVIYIRKGLRAARDPKPGALDTVVHD